MTLFNNRLCTIFVGRNRWRLAIHRNEDFFCYIAHTREKSLIRNIHVSCINRSLREGKRGKPEDCFNSAYNTISLKERECTRSKGRFIKRKCIALKKLYIIDCQNVDPYMHNPWKCDSTIQRETFVELHKHRLTLAKYLVMIIVVPQENVDDFYQ